MKKYRMLRTIGLLLFVLGVYHVVGMNISTMLICVGLIFICEHSSAYVK